MNVEPAFALDTGTNWTPWQRARKEIPRLGLTEGAASGVTAIRPASSAFSDDREPTWLRLTVMKLSDLINLPEGWDGHLGRPVDFDVAKFAVKFLASTLDSESPAPQIVPLSYGGLQLEWHERDIDLEIEIEIPNRLFVSFTDHRGDEEFEREFSADYSEVTRVLRILSTREA